MADYYVNNQMQHNGDHEVHIDGCTFLVLAASKKYLGNHSSCHSAVAEAKKTYSTADGCAYCSPACHTR